jgi:hypothetical protein
VPAHEVIDLGSPSQDEKTPEAPANPELPQDLDFLEMIARAYAVPQTDLYQKDMAVFLEWLRSHYHMTEPKETPSAQASGIRSLLQRRNKHVADPAYDVCHTISGNVKYNISRTHVTHAGKGKLTAEQAFEMALLASLNPVMQTSPLKLTGSAEDQALLKAACDKLNLRATYSVKVTPEAQADATHFIGKVYDKVNESKSVTPSDTPTNSQPTTLKNEDHLFDTIAPKPIREFKKQLAELRAHLDKLSHDSGKISDQFAKWGDSQGGDEHVSQEISDQTRDFIIAYKASLDEGVRLKTELEQKLETLKSNPEIDQRHIDKIQTGMDKAAEDLASRIDALYHEVAGHMAQFNQLNGDDNKLEFPTKVESPPDQGADSKIPDLTAQFNTVAEGLSSRPGYENDIEGVRPEMKNALRAAYIVAQGEAEQPLQVIDFSISALLMIESGVKTKQATKFDIISNILKETGHIDKDATRDEVLARLAAPSSQPA